MNMKDKTINIRLDIDSKKRLEFLMSLPEFENRSHIIRYLIYQESVKKGYVK